MSSLLVVEDDEKIGSMLLSALESAGHETTWERLGAGALDAATTTPFDLVLLDLGLPDVDGIEVCRRLKARQPGCVVVMLTARHDEMDVVVGLESGADDYLIKPFRMAELLARVRAHLRRAAPAPNAAPIACGDLSIDLVARRCTVQAREVVLRPKEFDLLVRLASPPGAAVSRDQLIADVWDRNWFGSTKTLDVHVAALRQRLAQAAELSTPAAAVPAITTLRGHGYRLD